MSRVAVNGVHYHVDRRGSGPALLLLHGFTGSIVTWADLAPRLADRFDTVAVDLLGHGASDAPPDPARYRMERCVADLVALLDALDLPRAAVLGYSMGGRVALHLALAAPARVGALVLESASPGILDAAERAARRASDAALADLLEREGIAAFVDRWERLPLWASQASLPREARARLRAQRLANRPEGLAGSLRGLGAGEMAPVHDRLGALGMPALLVAGALDGKYRALAESMAAAMPRARVAVVPGAGHAVHLERPEAFLRAVGAFLEEVAGVAAGGGEQA